MRKNKCNIFFMIAVFVLLLSSCGGSGGSSDEKPGDTPEPGFGNDTEIKITYNEGLVWQGTQIYCIWLESDTDNTILPVLITGRSRKPFGQIGSSLAYWRLNKKSEMESKLTSSDIDAVTSATPNLPAVNSENEAGKQIAVPIGSSFARGRGGFTITRSVPGDLRKFTVYFEIEHSYDANNYFNDQPSILYKAVVDLDALSAGDEVEFEFAGWTPYSTVTIDGISRPAGVLQTDLKYITTVDTFSETKQYPATEMMKNKAKVSILP